MHIGIDGCSAPTFAMPLYNAALGYARLAKAGAFYPENERRLNAIQQMIRVVTTAPLLVWGSKGFDTVLMKGI